MYRAINRARSRPGWLVPLVGAADVVVDGRLYLEWGSRVHEEMTSGIKLYRIGRATNWYEWANAEVWFPYQSSEGLQFTAACSEIIWREEGQPWNDAVRTHFAAYAPDLVGYDELVEAMATILTGRAEYERQWPRLVHDEPSWAIIGDIKRDSDSDVVNRLVEAGAEATNHHMIYPKYKSWARINPGKALQLTRDETVIKYVPHVSLGNVPVQIKRQSLQWTPAAFAQARWEIMQQRAEATLGTLIGTPLPDAPAGTSWAYSQSRTLPIVKSIHRYNGETTTTVATHESLRHTLTNRLIHATGDDIVAIARQLQVAIKQVVATGDQQSLTFANHTVILQPATATDLDDEWFETPHGWWYLRTSVDRVLAAGYALCESEPTLSLEYDEDPTLSPRMKQQQLRHSINAVLNETVTADVAKHVDYHLVSPTTTKLCISSYETVTVIRAEPVTAPFSERGTLTVTGDMDTALSLLRDVALADNLTEESSWGRHQPHHDAYSAGAHPAIPDGTMILHGMTGVGAWGQALTRFERMIESGGLLAVSERRRRGFGSTTMSPLGDIASGVDWGVPCTIGTQPSYGKWIIFGLKPTALARRDLWFSDRDFGGGKCRYDAYAAYAAKLGQRKTYEACPPDARDRHLRESHHMQYNEVWFRWSVTWDEIDTIFVTESGGLSDHVKQRIQSAQDAGLMPKDINVVSYTDRFGEIRDEEVPHHTSLRDAVVARSRDITANVAENPTFATIERREAAVAEMKLHQQQAKDAQQAAIVQQSSLHQQFNMEQADLTAILNNLNKFND